VLEVPSLRGGNGTRGHCPQPAKADVDRSCPNPLIQRLPIMPLTSRALPAGFIAPCLPSSAPQAPSGTEWLHEIKHDGFRVIARKEGKRVKLLRSCILAMRASGPPEALPFATYGSGKS
jgi:hypothetical protein